MAKAVKQTKKILSNHFEICVLKPTPAVKNYDKHTQHIKTTQKDKYCNNFVSRKLVPVAVSMVATPSNCELDLAFCLSKLKCLYNGLI